MIRPAVLLGTLLIALLLPAAAAAQTVRGWVRDEADGRPVRSAMIRVSPAGRDTVLASTLTSDGSFHFYLRQPGIYHLRVEALGYTPYVVETVLEEDAVQTLELRLRPDAVPLDAVRVVAERREPVFMRDIRLRQTSGFGRFIMREDLDDIGAGKLQDVLMNVSGLRVTEVAGGGGGRAIPMVESRRGAASSQRNCFASLYLNGIRQFEMRGDDALDPDQAARAEDLLALPIHDIEAVEVYRGVAELPAEYSGSSSACGVVAVWLRSGYDPEPEFVERPQMQIHVQGGVGRTAGDNAPGTAPFGDVAFLWQRSPRVDVGLRLRYSEPRLPPAAMATLTAGLTAGAYAVPAGSHPMSLRSGAIEARYQLLDRSALLGFVSGRVIAARRSFSLPHSLQGTASFSSGGWGLGASMTGDIALNDRVSATIGLGHDVLFFNPYRKLEGPRSATAATWSETSLRLGFGFVVAREN